MPRRYALEGMTEDEGLVDQPGDASASFTMTSRTANYDLQVSVLETLHETLAAG